MNHTRESKAIIFTAWGTVLLISLFKIVLQEIFKIAVSEANQSLISALIIAAGLILTLVWQDIRALRPFFGLFAVLVTAQWLVRTQLDSIPLIRGWVNHPSFNFYMLAEVGLNLIVTVAIILYLYLLKRQRKAFFLTRGDINAPVEPVKWLGIKSGENWLKLGWIFALCLSLGTILFLVISGRPSPDIFRKILPFIPAILLAATLNAFNEEMTYKASFLSVLEDVVGKNQALWLMAAFFGILHYYGIPYGIVGVILATFLGWLLGKSMLETRGLFWAWFLHFLQDVWIFIFLASSFITPGGK